MSLSPMQLGFPIAVCSVPYWALSSVSRISKFCLYWAFPLAQSSCLLEGRSWKNCLHFSLLIVSASAWRSPSHLFPQIPFPCLCFISLWLPGLEAWLSCGYALRNVGFSERRLYLQRPHRFSGMDVVGGGSERPLLPATLLSKEDLLR